MSDVLGLGVEIPREILVEIPGAGLGSNVVTCIGGGRGAFLLEYTYNGQEAGRRFFPCIMPCESFEVEIGEGGEEKGR